ncbi:MAG: envelope stress response membrane protein PspC [Sphingomonadaceae bacterium]|nr:envelope stress response membrane protein PspC [Sphingomonadaceae bacterium]
MSDRRTSYYLDKRNGKVKGVLAGVADYFDVDVLWVRLGFMMTLFFLFPPIFFAYWIVAWTASPKPYSLYAETPDEREFWTKVRVAPQRTIRDTRSSFRETERRLRDIEAYVTSSNSRLAHEIDGLK